MSSAGNCDNKSMNKIKSTRTRRPGLNYTEWKFIGTFLISTVVQRDDMALKFGEIQDILA